MKFLNHYAHNKSICRKIFFQKTPEGPERDGGGEKFDPYKNAVNRIPSVASNINEYKGNDASQLAFENFINAVQATILQLEHLDDSFGQLHIPNFFNLETNSDQYIEAALLRMFRYERLLLKVYPDMSEYERTESSLTEIAIGETLKRIL